MVGIVARFEQGSGGGGGRECPLLLVLSRGVVVVGVNGPRHSFWARERCSEWGVVVVGVNAHFEHIRKKMDTNIDIYKHYSYNRLIESPLFCRLYSLIT